MGPVSTGRLSELMPDASDYRNSRLDSASLLLRVERTNPSYRYEENCRDVWQIREVWQIFVTLIGLKLCQCTVGIRICMLLALLVKPGRQCRDIDHISRKHQSSDGNFSLHGQLAISICRLIHRSTRPA
jgi:hypothetical protein